MAPLERSHKCGAHLRCRIYKRILGTRSQTWTRTGPIRPPPSCIEYLSCILVTSCRLHLPSEGLVTSCVVNSRQQSSTAALDISSRRTSGHVSCIMESPRGFLVFTIISLFLLLQVLEAQGGGGGRGRFKKEDKTLRRMEQRHGNEAHSGINQRFQRDEEVPDEGSMRQGRPVRLKEMEAAARRRKRKTTVPMTTPTTTPAPVTTQATDPTKVDVTSQAKQEELNDTLLEEKDLPAGRNGLVPDGRVSRPWSTIRFTGFRQVTKVRSCPL
ncbi:uncharacterized protein LOC143021592 [Oratosquilla oratoria]|uniref:uncharacterized protein LOC143021592 n=1 Tax=Oratosquilla oratoria TaxID=337810 RepID=UPI003F76A542